MTRRSFIGGALGILGFGRALAQEPAKPAFPPVPLWQPSFGQPLDRIVNRMSYYYNGKADFAVFRNGTCALFDNGLDDGAARSAALKIVSDIFHAHPDMNPATMDDGNILVRYNHPAVNVVLSDVAAAHLEEIERRHLDGLAESEVLLTPLGQNKFDDFGKRALLGRAYFFMDAQSPDIVRIERATAK
jgi:hypothetical protein